MASPFRSLMGKELLAFRPFLVFAFFLVLLEFVEEALTKFPSQIQLDYMTDQHFSEAIAYLLLMAIFALAVTSGLLLREYDEKTLEFLDSLPLSRSQLFSAKIIMAMVTLAAYPLLSSLLGTLLHAFAIDSLDSSLHLGLLAQSCLLDLALVFFLLGSGTLLSLLRRFSWIVAVLILFFFMMAAKFWPSLKGFSPLLLIAPPMRGQLYVIPWKAVGMLCLISLLALGLSWAQFCRGGDWVMTAWGRFQKSVAGKVLLLFVAIPVFFVSMYLIARLFDPAQQSTPGVEVDSNLGNVDVQFPVWETATLTTDLYRISYPSNLRSRVQELASEADDAGMQIFDFFQARPEESIAVDATSTTRSHFAGQAEWQSISMGLAHQDDLRELEGTLQHETAHVLIEQLSQRRLRDHFNTIRVFHEGLAAYLEHEFSLRHRREELRFPAVVLRQRRLFDFELMADSTRLEAELGIEVIYSLGERLASVMVEKMDQQGIACLLQTPQLATGLRDLQGVPFWQAWVQSCGFDLERLLGAFFRELDTDARRRQAEIEALPRPRGRIEVEEGEIHVYVLAPGLPEGWDPECRFKTSAVAGPDDISTEYPGSLEEPCIADVESTAPNGTFYLQLGLYSYDGGYTLYEPWFQASLTNR